MVSCVCTGYYLQTTSRSQLGKVKTDCEAARAILKVLKEHNVILGKVDSSTLFLLHCRSFQQMWAILLLPRDALLGKLSETKTLVRLFVIGKFCWLVCARVYLVSVLIITPVYHTCHFVVHQVAWNLDKTVNDVSFYTFV